MGSFEITLEIGSAIEKALNSGYDRIYVNVDNLEDGFGFLRVLAMKKSQYLIAYEDILSLDECYRILDFLDKSEYDITDFTLRWDD